MVGTNASTNLFPAVIPNEYAGSAGVSLVVGCKVRDVPRIYEIIFAKRTVPRTAGPANLIYYKGKVNVQARSAGI